MRSSPQRASSSARVRLSTAGAGPAGRNRSSWSLWIGRPSVSRGLWRMGFQRVADESHEHPQIERGGRGADPARVACTVFPVEGEGEVAADEVARFEPREQAREQTLDDEGEGFESIDRKLEVDGFEQPRAARHG